VYPAHLRAPLKEEPRTEGSTNLIGSALQAMARQPEAAGMVRTTMFIGIAVVEALALLGFVLAFAL
jgi:ATP synthase F0 subunit c